MNSPLRNSSPHVGDRGENKEGFPIHDAISYADFARERDEEMRKKQKPSPRVTPKDLSIPSGVKA